jgi:hypothetical protein
VYVENLEKTRTERKRERDGKEENPRENDIKKHFVKEIIKRKRAG